MLKTFLFSAIITIVIISCEQKKTNQFQKEPDTTANSFFPLTQYILGQIKELDSLPIIPLKVTTINRKADSVWIKREEIRSFIQPFITPVIDSLTLHNYFSEKSFLDQTINAFTFSYDPIKPLPDSIELRRWDIYVDPQSNKVERIYIVKQTNTTPMKTIQLTWKSGYFCKITTITDNGNSDQEVKEQELIWNFND